MPNSSSQHTVEGGLTQFSGALAVKTAGIGFIDVTDTVAAQLSDWGVREGLLTLFVRHTSASLTIQENADPDVCADLLDALDRLAPQHAGYRHSVEGPDDMPAHIRAMMTSVHLSVPILDGQMVLGTWQGIYLIEHRARGQMRNISLHYFGSRLGSINNDE